jgi:uncharacterized protein (DUF2132 family)
MPAVYRKRITWIFLSFSPTIKSTIRFFEKNEWSRKKYYTFCGFSLTIQISSLNLKKSEDMTLFKGKGLSRDYPGYILTFFYAVYWWIFLTQKSIILYLLFNKTIAIKYYTFN